MSVNKVILVGNLGRDPEVRTTSNGSKVVQLSIATSERWRDRATGEQREKTEWHRVVIFNERLADVAERYLQRGRQVYIEGQNAVLIDDVGDGRALHLQGAPGHHGRWRYAVERHRPLIGRMDGEVA